MANLSDTTIKVSNDDNSPKKTTFTLTTEQWDHLYDYMARKFEMARKDFIFGAASERAVFQLAKTTALLACRDGPIKEEVPLSRKGLMLYTRDQWGEEYNKTAQQEPVAFMPDSVSSQSPPPPPRELTPAMMRERVLAVEKRIKHEYVKPLVQCILAALDATYSEDGLYKKLMEKTRLTPVLEYRQQFRWEWGTTLSSLVREGAIHQLVKQKFLVWRYNDPQKNLAKDAIVVRWTTPSNNSLTGNPEEDKKYEFVQD